MVLLPWPRSRYRPQDREEGALAEARDPTQWLGPPRFIFDIHL